MKKAKIIGLTLSLALVAAALPAVTPATDVSAVAEAATVPVTGGKWIKTATGAYQYQLGGKLLTGWQYIQSKTGAVWYYFNTKGVMQTGWKQIGGKWYYFKTTGAMVTGWKQIGGKWYFFATNGAMANGWKKIGGKWYFFRNGAMVTGWLKVGGKQYYFNASGVMQTGTKTIAGQKYTFDANGVLQEAPKKKDIMDCTMNEWIAQGGTMDEWMDAHSTKTTEQPATTHQHTWATKEVVVDTIWHEPVTHEEPYYNDGWTEYIYEKQIKCSTCKQFFKDWDAFEAHDYQHSLGGYSYQKVLVKTIEHDPEIIGYETVVDKAGYYEDVYKTVTYCTGCGKEK